MKLVRAILVVAVGAVVPLVPVAAHAKSDSSVDPTNDVVTVTLPGGTTTPAPDRTEGDIVSSRVTHRTRSVILTMRFQELTAGQTALHWYGIRTGTMTRVVLLEASPSNVGGKARLFKPNGRTVRCHVGRSIDYTANTATVRVPTACLGRPRRVKVSMQEATPISSNQVYVDDAHSNGGYLPVYGRWVRR